MFDKLIESDSHGADFKNRSRYFMVSSMVVGILFVTAVVFSLYAQEIGLGNQDFELAELLAPLTPDVPEVKQPKQTQPQTANNKNELPSRQAYIPKLEDVQPTPTSISVTPNTSRVRPDYGPFDIGPLDLDPAGPPSGLEQTGSGTGSDPRSSNQAENIDTKIPDPPPAIKPKVEIPKPPRSIGVANGIATYLPKPPYPPAAVAVNIQGNVNVQVTISETGKVISSKAINGPAMLRGAAERAAWNAKFTPTLLSNVPVKVTGVIVYKFSRN